MFFDVVEPDESVRYVVCDIRVRKPACEFFESAARVQSFVFRVVFGRDKSYRHVPCVDEKTENYLILGCGEIGKSENINVGVRKVVADTRRKRFEPRGRINKRFVQYFKIFFVNNTDVFQFFVVDRQRVFGIDAAVSKSGDDGVHFPGESHVVDVFINGKVVFHLVDCPFQQHDRAFGRQTLPVFPAHCFHGKSHKRRNVHVERRGQPEFF